MSAAGAVTHICRQVAISDDKAIVFEALGAISNLVVTRREIAMAQHRSPARRVQARSAVARRAVCAEKGVAVTLVVLERDLDDGKMVPRALDALLRVCGDADGTHAVAAADGVRVVVDALERCAEPAAKKAAIAVLGALLRDGEARNAFARDNQVSRRVSFCFLLFIRCSIGAAGSRGAVVAAVLWRAARACDAAAS